MADYDVLIVGAGPAGLAAAREASRHAGRVTIIDDNPAPGGQIWRGEPVEDVRGELLNRTTVVDAPRSRVLLVEDAPGAREIGYGKLVLATGARERLLPFPGWTLPKVMGAGGLQAMVRAGFPIEGKTVVVAGSGPLLLAVAAHLREAGARVPVVAEQAPFEKVARFGAGLIREPDKLWQAAQLRLKLLGTRYLTGCWPVEATESVVRLRTADRIFEEPCDLLACGFGLVPNLELPRLLGCAVRDGFVAVDDRQQTSIAEVFAAGEVTGIGGVDVAVAEGRTAGLAAAGQLSKPPRRDRRFEIAMAQAFALRPELRELASDDTIVCRCEDVTAAGLRSHDSWRAAKLHTRCGMGPCQGRVCGPATEFLFGWGPDGTRPPVYASRVGTLAATSKRSKPAVDD